MKIFATITVIGRDKTGVVAAITSFLFEQKGNIEALEEQVTRGQFSMTIQVSWKPIDCSRVKLLDGLEAIGRKLQMEMAIRFTQPGVRQRMAVFVTREDHCLKSLLENVKSGRLKAEVAVIVSNRGNLKSIAKEHNIPFRVLDWTDRATAENKALALLDKFGADFVVLARFMKILSPNFVWRFKNKIINVHPSLLPSFPGPQAYRQAYEHGVKVAGVTAHFVSMQLDEGPIIVQKSFAIRPSMSLAEIVWAGQKLEAVALVKAVRLYLSKRLDVYWGVVREI
ncbi:MAG: Formyl transferase [Verrucomicrobiales bacterium]|nr:Formyl transferase [Verrucomicrobiales bacterium]